jgi:hypothetical protein
MRAGEVLVQAAGLGDALHLQATGSQGEPWQRGGQRQIQAAPLHAPYHRGWAALRRLQPPVPCALAAPGADWPPRAACTGVTLARSLPSARTTTLRRVLRLQGWATRTAAPVNAELATCRQTGGRGGRMSSRRG